MEFLKEIAEVNEKAVEVSKGIHILSAISWDRSLETEFIEGWRKGNPKIPKPKYSGVSFSEQREQLKRLSKSVVGDHPLEIFTRETIQSYIDATLLIEAIESKRFEKISKDLYGSPGDFMPGTKLTNLSAAENLLKVAKEFDHPFIKEPDACVSAEVIRDEIMMGSKRLGPDIPEVKLDPDFAAKASASMSTIKIRQGTSFTKYDTRQLLVHEVMTHALTAINGSKQPYVSLMGRGAPRTTSTQEGLATFSEMITGAIDLKRLIRLALRVLAIDKALNGADFIEVFEYFVSQGQSHQESFWSTARIFRGGLPEGGAVFTKDSVYLDGLLKVNALFHWALHENRPLATHLLFCGRMSIDDIFLLGNGFKDGTIAQPAYIPEWYEDVESLAGNLAFSLLNTLTDLTSLNSYFYNLETRCRPSFNE